MITRTRKPLCPSVSHLECGPCHSQYVCHNTSTQDKRVALAQVLANLRTCAIRTYVLAHLRLYQLAHFCIYALAQVLTHLPTYASTHTYLHTYALNH